MLPLYTLNMKLITTIAALLVISHCSFSLDNKWTLTTTQKDTQSLFPNYLNQTQGIAGLYWVFFN